MVMMDPSDAPDIVTLADRAQRARKVHTCYMCREPITVGVLYRTIVSIYDGKFDVLKMHGVCPNEDCA